ncbi:Histone deacetylase 10 [Bagarius yarrelli]|uniref:Histone deacetylase 10 n=1 Tax=Bagarius yarrelli TaxID=175774 RepID=A0A556TI09_BAGYA|nr:Histone deacetylase 10 [Bagarius yarrelli]
MSETGLVYDEEMTRYKLLWTDPVCKIEVPERLTVSHEALKCRGLDRRCVCVPTRQATDQEILLVHSKEYLEAVSQTPHMSLEDLLTFTQQYGDVYFHPVSHDVAWHQQLPPGHHSQRCEASGFCVFNNVAIAALYAKQHYKLNRVLIVDWDIHHGQGVQYCFEEDSSVLYFSWHRYEHQQFWPNLAESDYDSVGKGKGTGFNINLPWNKVGMTSSDYLSAFFHVLLPIAYEFDPELVFVCAGFDSAIGDPEGGYNLTSLPQSVCQTVHTLLGDPTPELRDIGPPCHSALESVHNVRAVHQRNWGCLKHIEPSIKRSRVDEKVEQHEEETTEHLVWPEPIPRDAPPLRTAARVSKEQEELLSEACLCLGEKSPKDLEEAEKIRNKHFQDVTDEKSLKCIQDVVSLWEKIKNKEVRNGLVVVSDVFVSLKCAVELAKNSLSERTLVLFVGDDIVPVDTNDGKVLLVQICRKEPSEVKSVYHVPVCLNKDVFSCASVMAAVLGLLLPLAYEFNPSLVLQVMAEGSSGLKVCVWAQLTSLLQGVAQGTALALLKGCDSDMVQATAASLSGASAPTLGPLGPPLTEDLEAIEAQRHRLQKRWGLLVNSVSDKEKESQDQ